MDTSIWTRPWAILGCPFHGGNVPGRLSSLLFCCHYLASSQVWTGWRWHLSEGVSWASTLWQLSSPTEHGGSTTTSTTNLGQHWYPINKIERMTVHPTDLPQGLSEITRLSWNRARALATAAMHLLLLLWWIQSSPGPQCSSGRQLCVSALGRCAHPAATCSALFSDSDACFCSQQSHRTSVKTRPPTTDGFPQLTPNYSKI